MERYEFKKKIGAGTFGTTYLAVDNNTKEQVAIKAIPLNKEDRQNIEDEISVLKFLSSQPECNKHIVCYYDTFFGLSESVSTIFIVTEYISGSTLKEYLRSWNYELPLMKKWEIFQQLIEGLSYIHTKGIAHRDIKLDNIMISNNIKYIDFGLSCVESCIEQGCQNICNEKLVGTLPYIAPEYIKSEHGNYQNIIKAQMSDIWSLGVVMYFINSGGKFPFSSMPSISDLSSISNAPSGAPDKTDVIGNIIWNYMLKNNPTERLTATQILTIVNNEINSLTYTGSYHLIQELGRGGYGVTYLVENNGNRYVLKALKSGKSIRRRRIIMDEIDILQKLSNEENCSPYVVCYYDNFPGKLDGDNVIFIVMEYIDGITLRKYRNDHNTIDKNILWAIFYNLASGLKFIHDQNIAHRDIKLDNIMISNIPVLEHVVKSQNDLISYLMSPGNIKYIDFGLSCVQSCLTPDCSNICTLNRIGTVGYAPPEIYNDFTTLTFSQLDIAKMGDIWSLGIVMYILANGKFPTDINHIESMYPYDPNINILIDAILKYNPSDRFSADDLVYIINKLITME